MKSALVTDEPLSVTIPTALRLSGIGRTKLYSLIAEGKLASSTVGRRRLVSYASLKALLDGKEAAV
jgi:excisionase family DNA binding protein